MTEFDSRARPDVAHLDWPVATRISKLTVRRLVITFVPTMGRKLVRLAHLLGLSFGYPRPPQRAARPESGLLADVRNFHSVRTKNPFYVRPHPARSALHRNP